MEVKGLYNIDSTITIIEMEEDVTVVYKRVSYTISKLLFSSTWEAIEVAINNVLQAEELCNKMDMNS